MFYIKINILKQAHTYLKLKSISFNYLNFSNDRNERSKIIIINRVTNVKIM